MGSDPEGLVSFSKSKGIVVQAYSPLGNNNKELISGEGYETVKERYDRSGPEVALRWVLQNNVSAVIKSTNKKHMIGNMGAFSWKLEPQDMEYLGNRRHPPGNPSFTCDE